MVTVRMTALGGQSASLLLAQESDLATAIRVAFDLDSRQPGPPAERPDAPPEPRHLATGRGALGTAAGQVHSSGGSLLWSSVKFRNVPHIEVR